MPFARRNDLLGTCLFHGWRPPSGPPPPQLEWHRHAPPGIAARERLLNAPVLPPDEDATARKFVLCSTTYFALDVAHIFASLIAGRAPQQWRGRLAHHLIQFVANLPALQRRDPPTAAVVRRYLLLAYLAEASTVVLRLRSLARARGVGGPALQASLLKALLASFALTRLVNFPGMRTTSGRPKARCRGPCGASIFCLRRPASPCRAAGS